MTTVPNVKQWARECELPFITPSLADVDGSGSFLYPFKESPRRKGTERLV